MSSGEQPHGENQSIWFDEWSLDEVNQRGTDCVLGLFEIELVERGPDFLVARMPVSQRVLQPAGVLHGGVSVVLAETVGTWASVMVVDRQQFHCVGLEVNANHLRPVASGWVTAKATPWHLGRSTHVWQIEICDDQGKRVCVSRLTVAVLATPSQY